MTESVAVLIPVKGFGAAKERLVGTLDDEARPTWPVAWPRS